jgi:alpha-galactosidase
MTASAAALALAGAGRIEPVWIGLRAAEATAAAEAALEQRPFALGETRIGALALELAVETRGANAWLHLRARNAGASPVDLVGLAIGFRWRDGAAGALRYLRNGWQSWSQTGSRELDEAGTPEFPSGAWLRGFHHASGRVPRDRSGWHESDLVTVVGQGTGGAACLLGAIERGSAFGVTYARRREQAVELEIELQIDAELAPGAQTPIETVRIALGRDANALLEDYAEDYGRRAGARVSGPFVAGWCSWYFAFHDVCEDDVRRNLDALVAARDQLPVEVVQLDDGYQRAVGDWRDANEKFPRGLAPLAREIHDAGFVPGLWTAPFCVTRDSELFAKRPDWLLQSDGRPFVAMHHPHWSHDGAVHALDASRPEVTLHLEGLFRELVELGFLYHKLDFLFVQAQAAAAWDAAAGRAARLRRGLEAIRSGVGEEVFLLGCGCPLGAAVGVVDGMRIGPDVAPRWGIDEATAIPGIEEAQPSARGALRSTLTRAWMHRRLWQNDPDCLLVRSRSSGLSRGEREALATGIAATGGSCVFSDDLATLTQADRSLLAATLRGAQASDRAGIPGSARVVDLLEAELPGHIQAWDGADRLAGYVNASQQVRRFELDPAPTRACIGEAPGGSQLALAPRSGCLLRHPHPGGLAIFCDFDGTFSVQDVGATLAARYAAERRPGAWQRFERGEIQAWDYNLEILHGLPVPLHELESFLCEVALDPGARDLLAWCEAKQVPFRILSDGFDWNLNRLQVIHRVRFAYTANHLRYQGGRWAIRAGAPDPGCGCGTGTCKARAIGEYRREHPHATIVHVGNGRVSDTCGALAADLAFAKDSLAEELSRRGAAFEPFETLRDVPPRLERLVAIPEVG